MENETVLWGVSFGLQRPISQDRTKSIYNGFGGWSQTHQFSDAPNLSKETEIKDLIQPKTPKFSYIELCAVQNVVIN